MINREETPKIPKDILKHVHQFKPDGVDFATVVVPTWSAMPTELLALNEKAMGAEDVMHEYRKACTYSLESTAATDGPYAVFIHYNAVGGSWL